MQHHLAAERVPPVRRCTAYIDGVHAILRSCRTRAAAHRSRLCLAGRPHPVRLPSRLPVSGQPRAATLMLHPGRRRPLLACGVSNRAGSLLRDCGREHCNILSSACAPLSCAPGPPCSCKDIGCGEAEELGSIRVEPRSPRERIGNFGYIMSIYPRGSDSKAMEAFGAAVCQPA